MAESGADPALVASQSSQSPLSRPSGFDPGDGFTPGPWNFCSCGCGFVGGGDDEVCKVTSGPWGDVGVDFFTGEKSLVHHWGTVPPERALANGRLIAAAPDLAAALQYARNLIGPDEIIDDALARIEAGTDETRNAAQPAGREPVNSSNPSTHRRSDEDQGQ